MRKLQSKTDKFKIMTDFNTSLSIFDKARNQKTSKDTEHIINIHNLFDLMGLIVHSIQPQLSTHSLQVHIEHLPR